MDKRRASEILERLYGVVISIYSEEAKDESMEFIEYEEFFDYVRKKLNERRNRK